MKNSKIRSMAACALMAALTAVLSQIVVPIGPVPINLATVAVFLAGALLGPWLGGLSLLVWAVMGALGIPVFAMFNGGLGALFGATGGYIIGYIPAAVLVGLILRAFESRRRRLWIYPVSMVVSALVYFVIGTAWYMMLSGASFAVAMSACVLPFLPGEAVKIAAATGIAWRLRPVMLPRFVGTKNALTQQQEEGKNQGA